MRTACSMPSGDPVASTTQSYAAAGNRRAISVAIPARSGDAQLLFVPSELMHCGAVHMQDLADQQAEFAVAQNGYRSAARNPDLIEDLAGRGNRFGEDRVFVRNGTRARHADCPRAESGIHEKRRDASQFPSTRPMRAMPAKSAPAPIAVAASQVDFAHDAASAQLGIRAFHHFANKLVARRSAEAIIAALKFQVGIADASVNQPNQREAVRNFRTCALANRDVPTFEMNREHAISEYSEMFAIRSACLVGPPH